MANEGSAARPGAVLSHYRLLEKIGEGGMGSVWRAEDTILGRPVAIKVLLPDSVNDEHRREMFLQEARAAASLGDAHIVGVHEFARDAGLDYIVMEYVEGRPLSKILHGRPLPPDKVAVIGHQVARAMSKAHRRGLLHRDLKPSNIIVTPEGDAKVVDFGLATLFASREMPQTSEMTDLSQARTVTQQSLPTARQPIAGTLPYMSPEQVRGERLDARSDIFSLGAVLYELATGQRPFEAGDRSDLAAMILRARVVPPHSLVPRIPLDLDRLILKALSAKPGDRYQTMEDLAVDLKRLGRDLESGSSPSYESLNQAVHPKRRLTWLRAATGGVVLLAVVAGGLTVLGLRKDRAGAGRQQTLLILPLEVRGQAEEADYVGSAFAEAIAVNLSRARSIHVLPVPSRRDVTTDRGATDPIRLAREAGAGRVLHGSLTRTGNGVQASVMLMDVARNRVEWGTQEAQVDPDLPRLAAVLADRIGHALGAEAEVLYEHPRNVTGGPAMAGSGETARALGALKRTDVPVALDATERLVAAFPRDRAAQVLRAAALYEALWFLGLADSSLAELDRALARLDELDPNNPYSGIYRAAYKSETGAGHDSVLQMLEDSLGRDDLSPELRAFGLIVRGWVQRRIGRLAESMGDLEEARRLDPTSAAPLREIGETLRVGGRPAEALVFLRQAIALEPSWINKRTLGFVLSDMGRYEEAARSLQASCEAVFNQEVCAFYATVLHRAGDEDGAREVAARAASLPENLIGLYNLACYHAVSGQKAAALRFLRRALDLGLAIAWISDDPDLDSLRQEPDFQAMVAETRRRNLSE